MSRGTLQHVDVRRSDPVYAAHGYLTKVPLTAIVPFIEAFSEPGQVVLDPFAGSGMTGVAAAVSGRKAELRDINVLGQHIGTNYLNVVPADPLRRAGARAADAAKTRVGDVYATRCARCSEVATLSRTTWSQVFGCRSCGTPVNYYVELERAGWKKSGMACPGCNEPFIARGSVRVGEAPVLDTITCSCSAKLQDQPHEPALVRPELNGLAWPEVEIGSDRQMFQASALAKHNLLTTASFFSERNLSMLASLRASIDEESDPALRNKLLFAFTAILARASKRYQWSRKRPLNAANQNYYIAPVFYEWNVLDLFVRKVEAAIRSDEFIVSETHRNAFVAGRSDPEPMIDANYQLGSADALDLGDASIDYVFTDPPFGSNIFYSDMSLFQEAWIGRTTDYSSEAVVDRSGNGATRRTADRYELLMTGALRECHRVLRADGWLSLVFSNSSGAIWALVQRAVAAAGFAIAEDRIAVLDKGQRSVKGLASGFENVVTADLVISMQKTELAVAGAPIEAPEGFLDRAVAAAIAGSERDTPTHVYLGVVRSFLRDGVSLAGVDLAHIAKRLSDLGFEVDPSTGTMIHRDGTA